MADETADGLGEDALVERLVDSLQLPDDVVAGPGDDCAVTATQDPRLWQLHKVDCLVEGVHFAPQDCPERVGWKAAARVVSDFAAMGAGKPKHALVCLVLPGRRPARWASELYTGLNRCAARYGFAIIGGETSRPANETDGAMISVSAVGEIPAAQCVLRSGAKPGDEIWVTGTLGGSVASGKHLDFAPRLEHGAWLAERGWPSAMMDLSDGPAADLPRLCRASNVGFRINRAAIPRTPGTTQDAALGEGEDYELLFTATPGMVDPAGWRRAFSSLQLTRIGQILPSGEGDTMRGGWDHFGSRERCHNVSGPAEMLELGRRLARDLSAGDVLALVGDLGAGKTHLAKGIATGLGAGCDVASPTFSLVHEYKGGRLPVFHCDFYRIEDAAEILDLGWDEMLDEAAVILVEWADRFAELLPEHTQWWQLEITGADRRQVQKRNGPP